ncbi:MAG: MtrB/PioB family decaheme-associated outer membrane protein, partial [Betaproteobacteria bacterium]|nr:MtrB/PioB family decaheme-associated outer membrane protein [Betaproteobacteria bacterium]
WDAVRIGLAVEPAARWGMKSEYTPIEKRGDLPLGMTSGFSPQEILEPIEQTVHDLKVSQAFYRENVQLQLSYDLSLFQNDLDRVVADNPFRSTDHPTLGGARGRAALPPDNVAHSLGLAGGVNLPWKTRVSGGVSYGWRRQDQEFLPHTINSAISDSLLELPQPSLDGDQRLLRFHVVANTRPLPRLNLTARYRYFDYDDRTTELDFPAHVGYGDRMRVVEETDAHRHPYTRQIGGLDATYGLLNGVRLKAGYGWEGMGRGEREVANSSEHTTRAALDLTRLDWLLLRASYAVSWRRGDEYEVEGDVILPELRRFDVADRDRTRAELLARLFLHERLTLSTTYGRGTDEFPESAYGLQSDRSWTASAEVTWTPLDRLELYAAVGRDDAKLRQRSRSRTPPALLDNLTYDWVANTTDRTNTISTGWTLVVLPGKLDLGASWDVSESKLEMAAFNPTTPTGGTTAQNTSATAQNFPTIRQKLRPVSAFLRYSPDANWTATVRYGYERFQENDFRSDGLYPARVTNGIFLGQDYQNYYAHLLTLTVGFRPALLRPARSTL